jgi:Flp pilus assembly protein TadD
MRLLLVSYRQFRICFFNYFALHHLNQLELSLQLNLAMAEIKLENWTSAKKAATAAVAIEPTNVKALFRRGMALARSGSLEEATADLSKCLVSTT